MRAPPRSALLRRLAWSLVAALALLVLVLARRIPPAASGVGSHVWLGLPACTFLDTLGLPCPACGLTTAFAHLARLELLSSLRAHPLGLPLFLLTVAAIPLALAGALRGVPIVQALDRLHVDRVALWLASGLLVSWLARLVALVERAP